PDTGRGLGLTPELGVQDPPPAEPEEDRDPSTGAEGPSEPPPEPDTPAGGEKEEPQSDAQRGPCPDTPKAVPPAEDRSGTSSDDEVEGKGLRRRLGQEPRAVPPRPVPPQCRGTPDTGDEEGLSMSRYLLGALVLVAVGLLIVSGDVRGAQGEGGPQPLRAAPSPSLPQDSQQKPPAADPQEPRSLQSVSLLLDRLAKENQEIRLMQAELQAHKEELQALLHRSEGEAAAAGLQRQSLAAENSRLQAALERESAALRDARAELQRLRGAGPPEQP
ncbi:PBIP1 protein, partial [Rhinopomastus cyanomelas]|nr:PBIP1 protein [Rhinopomastus cyanomelas]